MKKGIWTRKEIPIAEELLEFKQGLIKDFMAGFDSLDSALAQCENSIDPERQNVTQEQIAQVIVTRNTVTNKFEGNVNSWKSVLFRYVNEAENIFVNRPEEDYKAYPTAKQMIDKYDKICPMMNYALMGPNTILHRHNGPENRLGKYIRIHIPLIVPEGEIFFEVNGEEIRWDDIFGFNNQLLHSVHNYTPFWRLVFIIDLERTAIGMEPGDPFDVADQNNALPFVRGKV
jgi:Aspartyl/Asparaginyl beta-hydroxylase